MITVFHEPTHPLVLLDASRNGLLHRHSKAIAKFADASWIDGGLVQQRQRAWPDMMSTYV